MFIELDWIFEGRICLNTDCIIAVVPNTEETYIRIVMKDDTEYTVKNDYEDIIALLNPSRIYQEDEK